MNNSLISMMKEEIEKEIRFARYDYELSHEYSATNNARINGMIKMLALATGNTYYYDEEGLHERTN